MKRCTKCGELKGAEEYAGRRAKAGKNWNFARCRSCRALENAKYVEANREALRLKRLEKYRNDPAHRAKNTEQNRKYRQENKARIKELRDLNSRQVTPAYLAKLARTDLATLKKIPGFEEAYRLKVLTHRFLKNSKNAKE